VGGTIYNNHTPELGVESQRVKKLASKLHVHYVNYAAKIVNTGRALSSTIFNSHHEPVSGQACNPPDPHWKLFLVEEFNGTQYQSGSFSLIDVGCGFCCLNSFFIFFRTGLNIWNCMLCQGSCVCKEAVHHYF
jgi:hypothetical protein